MNRFLRLLMLGACLTLAPTAFAQQPPAAPQTPPAGDDTITRGTKLDANDAKPEGGKEQPILSYFLALLGSGGILYILCSPGRKK